MPATIGIDEVQARLKDIIAGLGLEDEVVITDNDRPVARLVGERPTPALPAHPETARA